MERRDLGQSGLRLPVIGMGTWRTFDVIGKEAQTARRRLVERAIDLGVDFFDTSPMYGQAERVLGAALAGIRKRAIVATKVWSRDTAEGHRQIDRALHYFEGHVELYQVHNLVNWEAYLPAFERMKRERTVVASGVTHYLPSSFPAIASLIERRLVDAIQIPYNPALPDAARTLLPLAAEHAVGVIVMRPFDEGRLLQARLDGGLLRRLEPFGVRTWPQAILKWILSDMRVTSVIPATRRVQHLEENAAAGDPPWFGPEERAAVAEAAARIARQSGSG